MTKLMLTENGVLPSDTSARTWIVVLNYQGRNCICDCLKSLLDQEIPAGGAHILVVDNASTDGSLEIVRQEFPDVQILENPRNLGFAAGNNVGIRRAISSGAKYVVLVNMDARVHPRCISRLVEVAEVTTDAALIGARILNQDGNVVEFDGQQFDPVTTSGGYSNRPFGADTIGVREAAYSCGAGMLMRTTSLRIAGLFDEGFFAYHEDVELSLRCWLHGYRVLNVDSAIIYHSKGGAGAGVPFRDFMGTRNLVLTIMKIYDRRTWNSNGDTLVKHFADATNPERLRAVLSAVFQIPAVLEHRRYLRSRAVLTYNDLVGRLCGRIKAES